MTATAFCDLQDTLGLTNSALAAKLHRDASSVSRWRTGERPIPARIANLMAQYMEEIEVTLPLNELIAFTAIAKSRGLTFGRYLVTLLREDARRHIQSPAEPPPDTSSEAHPDTSAAPSADPSPHPQ